MKEYTKLMAIFAVSIATCVRAFAQVNVPSDGSDGALNITSNTVIDLSQAATGTWSNPSAGNGTYDPAQWAVVFKYSSVNVATGATVTFANHYANPPVIWLVQSNVIINGTVSVNGNNGVYNAAGESLPTLPGPGGFRGGSFDPSVGFGDGLGPGGGIYNNGNGNQLLYDATYQNSYGGPQILPLIGGSGSASYDNGSGESGGAGAGAILIAAGGTVTVNGQITAIPGYGGNTGWLLAAGGGIRIIANQIGGNGVINAAPQGRTRMEANSMSQQLNITPNAELVSPGSVASVFPSNSAPSVSIVSVGGLSAPADPQANVTTTADIGLATNSSVTVVLQTSNFPITGTVTLRVVPIYGASSVLPATFTSGTVASATWQLTSQIPLGYCVLQAHATSP